MRSFLFYKTHYVHVGSSWVYGTSPGTPDVDGFKRQVWLTSLRCACYVHVQKNRGRLREIVEEI